MKFRYKQYGLSILRPVIPIAIGVSGRIVHYEVLVDSGADMCIFDAQIGELLGLTVTAGEKQMLGGITGTKEHFYLHDVAIHVGALLYNARVGFLPQMTNVGYGVVGQRGFFDMFIVKFDLRKEEIELSKR